MQSNSVTCSLPLCRAMPMLCPLQLCPLLLCPQCYAARPPRGATWCVNGPPTHAGPSERQRVVVDVVVVVVSVGPARSHWGVSPVIRRPAGPPGRHIFSLGPRNARGVCRNGCVGRRPTQGHWGVSPVIRRPAGPLGRQIFLLGRETCEGHRDVSGSPTLAGPWVCEQAGQYKNNNA